MSAPRVYVPADQTTSPCGVFGRDRVRRSDVVIHLYGFADANLPGNSPMTNPVVASAV